jgi:hypothetical protein
MIETALAKLPSTGLMWAMFIPLAIAILSINTLLERGPAESNLEPTAQVSLPPEWRLPPGVVLHQELR